VNSRPCSLQKYAQRNVRIQVRPLLGTESTMAWPPESSLARLLKLRRANCGAIRKIRRLGRDCIGTGTSAGVPPTRLAWLEAISAGSVPDNDVISIAMLDDSSFSPQQANRCA